MSTVKSKKLQVGTDATALITLLSINQHHLMEH